MKLFTNLKKAAPSQDREPEKTVPSPVQHLQEAVQADRALDTLASLLRDTGRYAYDLNEEPHPEFEQRCEAWARHVLTGTPPDPAMPAPLTPSERAWGDLKVFFRNRRKREMTYVVGHVSEFKDVIFDLVGGLRALAGSGRSTEETIKESLSSLEQAVAQNSLTSMRSALTTTIGTIQQALEQQRALFNAELEAMSERVEVLRNDLLATRREAEQDPLTGLFNRRAFDASLAQSINLAGISDRPLALLMVDMDHFKLINDQYGHPAGDAVLKVAADNIIRSFPRKSDFVARYGGEEFAVLLFDVQGKDLPRLAGYLLDRMRATEILYQEHTLSVTCSIGYAYFKPTDTPMSLFKRADIALYAAKEAGRDRVVGG